MTTQKADQLTTPSTETETKHVEVLVDALLDKVMGGMAESTLCQHCNQPCGDCVQPA